MWLNEDKEEGKERVCPNENSETSLSHNKILDFSSRIVFKFK